VHDLSGRQVVTKRNVDLSAGEALLSIPGLAPGMYRVSVGTAQGAVAGVPLMVK
jgi:hypothetical protein